MTYCNDQQHHPQVPKTRVTIMLSWCHNCQCWVRYADVSTDDPPSDIDTYDHMDIYYGPFDGASNVLDDAVEYLSGVLFAPGRPWDIGGWLRGPYPAHDLTQDTP
jgi:hypothetical protein